MGGGSASVGGSGGAGGNGQAVPAGVMAGIGVGTNPPQNDPNVQNDNNPTVPAGGYDFAKMTDDELYNLVSSSQGVNMPNYLADARDTTQEFVYTAGLNDKPIVVDESQFDSYIAQLGIPKEEVLVRSVDSNSYQVGGTTYSLTPKDMFDMERNLNYNYIGGKHGGQAYGAGFYMARSGGANTGYGKTSVRAVLNPKTAKAIELNDVSVQWRKWSQTHPKTAQKVNSMRGTVSVKALLMGYNVINETGNIHGRYSNGKVNYMEYNNIIDRKALIISSGEYRGNK